MVLFILMFSTEWTFGEGSEGASICKTGIDTHIKVQWKDACDPFQSISDLVTGLQD
jgi:hypothetical protein